MRAADARKRAPLTPGVGQTRRRVGFDRPGDLDRFVSEVRADLEAAGLRRAAERLAEIQRTAFTTGSEWLGELGAAVREIRSEGALGPELDAKLKRIMAQVRRIWPHM